MNISEYWNKSQTKHTPLTNPSQYSIKVEKLFSRNSNILDIGGACGNDSIYFQNKGHIPTIIDISTVAQQEAKNRRQDISFIIRDLISTPYPFNDRSFDIVFSRLTLQYFTPEEILLILKEVKRLLKTNGMAYISVKSIFDEKEMQSLRENGEEITKGVFQVDKVIKSRYAHEQWKEFVLEAGFTEFQVNEITEKLNYSNKHGNSKLLLTELVIKNS
jgi:ubiquinone/menaquinone biosynthesis C-methylase UbiE